MTKITCFLRHFQIFFNFGAILAHQISNGMFSGSWRIFWHPWDLWGRIHIDLNKNSVWTGCVKKNTNQKENEPKRAQTKKGTIQKGHEPKTAQTKKCTNQKQHETKKGTNQKQHEPKRDRRYMWKIAIFQPKYNSFVLGNWDSTNDSNLIGMWL